jgi:isochorismatase family protein
VGVVLFIDLQAGIADLPLTVPYARLRKGVFALSRLAHLLGMPAIVSAVMGQDGSPARIMPEIAQGLGELPVYYRTTADSFENQTIKQAIEATGRKTILIAGTATEVAVQLPALSGSDMGYRVFIVIDAVAGLIDEHLQQLERGSAGPARCTNQRWQRPAWNAVALARHPSNHLLEHLWILKHINIRLRRHSTPPLQHLA